MPRVGTSCTWLVAVLWVSKLQKSTGLHCILQWSIVNRSAVQNIEGFVVSCCLSASFRNFLAERCSTRNRLSHQVDLHHIFSCASQRRSHSHTHLCTHHTNLCTCKHTGTHVNPPDDCLLVCVVGSFLWLAQSRKDLFCVWDQDGELRPSSVSLPPEVTTPASDSGSDYVPVCSLNV